MFCSQCGNELPDGSNFCPECGARIENFESETVFTENFENVKSSDEKFNWREFLTMDNIERFAPVAAFLPLIMALVTGVLGNFLLLAAGRTPIVGILVKLLVFLLKLVFVLAPFAAVAGLIYVLIYNKHKSNAYSWITVGGVGIAAVSCLCIAFKLRAPGLFLGLIAFVMGLEFLARIVIAGQPIDTRIDPAETIAIYKSFYNIYREKYPSTKDMNPSGVVDLETSYFDGTGLGLFGYWLLAGLVTMVTCGLAAPWMICMVYRWQKSHTVIGGRRLTFTGTGGSLFLHWLLWEILTCITCGIFGFFMYVRVRKWMLNRIFIDGEPIVSNGEESFFDGGTLAYIGYSILGTLMLLLTCFLSYPWVCAMLYRWDTSHQVINRRRLVFKGSGMGFLLEFLLVFILSLITCGLYLPWGAVRIQRYLVRYTDFA